VLSRVWTWPKSAALSLFDRPWVLETNARC
jgi:hypothetical protein